MQSARWAAEQVFMLCSRDRRKRRSDFVMDPATRALEVRPECRLKIEQALRAEAHRIASRDQRSLLFLKFEEFFLDTRLVLLKAVRFLYGQLF